MRDFLIVLGITILALLVALGLAKVAVRVPPGEVIDTKPRLLTTDTEFYLTHTVRMSTQGFEVGETTDHLVFRDRADKPPVIICVFEGRVPDPLPAKFTGTVESVRNGTVLVTGCRAEN